MNQPVERIVLRDVTGQVWISDPDVDGEMRDPNSRSRLLEILEDWGSLNYLAIEIDGRKTWFNPANVISVTIAEEKQQP